MATPAQRGGNGAGKALTLGQSGNFFSSANDRQTFGKGVAGVLTGGATVSQNRAYFGGNPDALHAIQAQDAAGIDAGADISEHGTNQLSHAGMFAQGAARGANQDYAQGQATYAADRATGQTAYAGAQDALSQQRGVISAQQSAVDQQAAAARDLGSNYLTTDRMRLQQDMAANQRSLVGSARGMMGGAGGVRAALQAGAGANLTANGNAGITRANETNTLLGMRQNALENVTNAQSGITSAYGGVTSGASNIVGLNQNQQQISAAQRDAATQRGIGMLGAANSANSAVASTGTAREGNYLSAQTDANSAQLTTDQATNAAKAASKKSAMSKIMHPLGIFK